jgi:hypothetical protein
MSNPAVAALIALCAVAACSKNEKTTADTTTIPGVDTTKGKAMATTDTIVKTTTTKTDTLKGKATDTSKAASKTKTKSTKTKSGTKTKTKA